MRKYIGAFAILFLLILNVENVQAKQTNQSHSEVEQTQIDQRTSKETFDMEGFGTEDLLEEMDFSEIGDFLEKQEGTEDGVSFEGLVKAFLGQEEEVKYEYVGDYIKAIVLQSFNANRQLFLELLVVSLAYSILKNFSKSFSNSYISEICFFVCYCFMMLLLLQSFYQLNQTLQDTVGTMVDFMKLFIPTYCMAISFSLNLNSSAAIYSMIFMVIYIVEWLMRYFLVPLVQIYVLVEFLNHLMEEERFKRLAELIFDGVKVMLKAAISLILGINIIQGMIAPAMDRLTGNTIAKTVQMLPGIGNVMSGTGQILLSSGIVIKNCVGAAALVILIILCGVPFLNMAFIALMYKVLAAILEPVADKRIAGGMNGVANGGFLCLKIMTTCMVLFFLTIALSSTATNWNVGG